jgi:hypothetical protein
MQQPLNREKELKNQSIHFLQNPDGGGGGTDDRHFCCCCSGYTVAQWSGREKADEGSWVNFLLRPEEN